VLHWFHGLGGVAATNGGVGSYLPAGDFDLCCAVTSASAFSQRCVRGS
jgi:hypothetical protein